MIAYFIESFFVSTILYAFYIVFLSNTTFHQWNRFYLIFTMLLSILIPILEIPINSSSALYQITLAEITVEGNIANNSIFNYAYLLYCFYLSISAIFLLRLVNSIFLLNNIINKAKNENQIFLSDQIKSPCSFFNSIFLPKKLYKNEDINIIIEHEKIHVAQKHSFDLMLIETMKIFFWWNPVLFFIRKDLTAQHEYYVDRIMIEKHTSILLYSDLLIKQQNNFKSPMIVNLFNYVNIKNRFKMMTKQKSTSKLKLAYLGLSPLLAIIILIFSCSKTAEKKINHIGEVFSIVEVMPSYEGGDQAMLSFLYNNIKYPAQAKESTIDGMVVVSFIVEKDGSTSSHEILRDIGGGCGEEALRVIKKMNNWTPGYQNGEKVRVEYKLPVKFKLE